eukprot:Ihof_evm4s108 gene=Ihof_evmTU4s108
MAESDCEAFESAEEYEEEEYINVSSPENKDQKEKVIEDKKEHTDNHVLEKNCLAHKKIEEDTSENEVSITENLIEPEPENKDELENKEVKEEVERVRKTSDLTEKEHEQGKTSCEEEIKNVEPHSDTVITKEVEEEDLANSSSVQEEEMEEKKEPKVKEEANITEQVIDQVKDLTTQKETINEDKNHIVNGDKQVDEEKKEEATLGIQAKSNNDSTPVSKSHEVDSDPSDQRLGTLDTVDKSKKEVLDKGAVGSALFDRLAASYQEPPPTTGWGGGWGSLWQSASNAVNTMSDVAANAALTLLEDPGDRHHGIPSPVPENNVTNNKGDSDSTSPSPSPSFSASTAAQAMKDAGETGTEMASTLAGWGLSGLSYTTGAAMKLSSNLQYLAVDDVMEHSMGVLENIGKKTISVITERDVNSLSSNHSHPTEAKNDTAEEEIKPCEPISYQGSYEKYNGPANFTKLETTSRQSITTLQALLAALSPTSRKEQERVGERINDMLDEVGEGDDDDPQDTLTEAATHCNTSLETFNLGSGDFTLLQKRLKQEDDWLAKFRAKLNGNRNDEEEEEEGEEGGWEEDDVKLTIEQQLLVEPDIVIDEVCGRALDSMAFASATSLAQLAALADILLSERDWKNTPEGTKDKAEAVKQLGVWHIRLISHLSSAYVDGLNTLRTR